MPAKKRNFYGEKKGLIFCQKYEIQIFVKNATFFFGFSIVFLPNQGVQLKDRLFEQLAKYANDYDKLPKLKIRVFFMKYL